MGYLKYLKELLLLCVVMISVTALSGCASSDQDQDFIQSVTENSVYRLDTGDVLKITIFDEPDLSGEYSVDGTGAMTLPLVGEVNVAGYTPREAEKMIEFIFEQGYIKAPKVAIEVVEYRPFYIMGEVREPGSFPYVHGMTVMNAVALAGGYTYRADRDDILIHRPHTIQEGRKEIKTYRGVIETIVLPGDIVEIEERLF